MNSKKPIAIFAGGGTGGHVYPALAVSRELKNAWPELEILFVGSRHGLENKIVPQAGYKLLTLPVGGLLRMGRIQQLKTLLLLPACFFKSLWILLKYRPRFVLGVGGFAAGPLVLVSSLIRFQTFIWEPNAVPGITNRILSRFVRTAFVVFESAKSRIKSQETIVAGLPIRPEIIFRERPKSTKLRVLVFGGSQGARAINNAVCDAYLQNAELQEQIELFHQTGALDFEAIKARYQNSAVRCQPFIEDMAQALNWADLVIARGGVGSISEIIASRKASIIVPLPTAAENHQEANARFLVDRNAGEILLQKDLTPRLLANRLLEYSRSAGKIASVEDALKPLQRPNGAKQIAEFILKRLAQQKEC